jgi:hypothetical protein
MAAPLINGTQPSWASIEVLIGGTILTGFSSISYTDKEEIFDVYGVGNNPVARSYGNITREGSITFQKNELSALQIASPTGRIQDIPEFNIVITYLPKGLGVFTYDTLKNCRFKNNGVDASQNDDVLEISVDLAIGDIEFGRI